MHLEKETKGKGPWARAGTPFQEASGHRSPVFDADIGTQGLGVVDPWIIRSLTIKPRAGSIDVMNSRDAWAREVKKRLERAGYSVSVPGPALAMKKKRAGRLQDLRLLARGKASPEEIQNKNSLFRGRAKRFRIVDYGGLDDRR